MNVEVTPLPGIGVRKDFGLKSGRRLGVVTTKSGDVSLIISDPVDPDKCALSVKMTAEEAATAASLLGAPQLLKKLRAGQEDLLGLSVSQITVGEDSPYDGRPLKDTHIRSRTGTSVVAVLRAGTVIAAPLASFVITSGDILVVVGSTDNMDHAQRIINEG